MNTKEQILALIEDRRTLYLFLSRVYEKEFKRDGLKDLFDRIFQIRDLNILRGSKFDDGFETVRNYLKEAEKRDLAQVEMELAADYAGLFLGLWGKPLHPSESVCRSKGHLLIQESRDRVLKIYRMMGVDKVSEFREPEDHIAIELQFMAYLCRKIVDFLKQDNLNTVVEYLNVQKDFLKNHLAVWIPQFCQDIIQSPARGFYKGIAKITDKFVETDQEVIKDLINNVKSLI